MQFPDYFGQLRSRLQMEVRPTGNALYATIRSRLDGLRKAYISRNAGISTDAGVEITNRSAALSKSLVEIGVFSAVVNVLLLVSPLYLLQVYDRILPASSMNTLIFLTLFAVISLSVLGILEIVRSLYASRFAARFDVRLGPTAFLAAMNGPRASLGDIPPLRDLATIRTFIGSRALFSLFDLPFGPFFIVLLYFVHPLLFAITLFGALILIAVAVLNQAATSVSGREAGETHAATMYSAQTFARNFETVRAMGMVSNVIETWGNRHSDSLQASDKVARTNAFYGGMSRTIRMVLQLAVIGAGAYLVLHGEMTAGMIFAASLISGRALQPLDQIIGSWRQIIEANRAWKRMSALEQQETTEHHDYVELPTPSGKLNLDQVVYYPPNAAPGAPPLIKPMTLAVNAGEVIAITGPSQAGKSTLARLLVGATKPDTGIVRIDGADIQNWHPDQIGSHIGYLSQEVELFPGTISQNISRFDTEPSDEKIIEAAERAYVHQLVLGLPNGYSTLIGPGGIRLSGGERQRIGLARAFYGNPRLLVLDEPNANLDGAGEAALERAITNARLQRRTVLIITHRRAIVAKCDKILMLRDGQVQLFAPTQDFKEFLAQGQKKPAPRPTTPPVPANSETGSYSTRDEPIRARLRT